MGSKVYKYMGADTLKLSLSKEDVCSFKCSHPKDFNDPYELFLTIDFQQDPEMLATYKDTIGVMPQLPTTCFSKSPSVTPMWAHYAHGHRGVVIEIDEEIVIDSLPDVEFGDVDYRDEPSDDLLDMLARACHIGKLRYHFLLQRGVFSAAYYTKHTCWSYEQERRLVVGNELVNAVGDIILLDLPVGSITSLIAGHNATQETKDSVNVLADNIGANYFEMNIGKTTSVPYFLDSNGMAHQYHSGSIQKCINMCEECKEPISEEADLCSWCSITEDHEYQAASTNPLRMLQRMGGLEDYYESMMDVERKHDK
ncbi:MAG: DUF2971 domain-containing protein [Gammaproteobacteria bacterium]|nr:DUF2971 domain-containing protein [Gammaproteobacteria bacterium]